MSDAIQIVDPTAVAQAEPVSGLSERTPFRVDGRRLVLLHIDDASAWHHREGTVYGWIRAGDGHIAYSDGTTELEAGDFIHVPAGTAHRYAAGDERLEILAVVDGGTGPTHVEPPTTVAGDAEPDIVGPDGLVPTVESPDLTRETPFPDASILMMRVHAAGGAAAGWHHHGENVYFGYAVDGPSETEYGPADNKVERIEIGECFHIPPRLVHRDTNPTDEPHTGIIWLCGGEPWVVNVDGPG